MTEEPERPHDWLDDGEGRTWCTRCGLVPDDEADESTPCPAEGM